MSVGWAGSLVNFLNFFCHTRYEITRRFWNHLVQYLNNWVLAGIFKFNISKVVVSSKELLQTT